jgi:hypothetical protein
MLGPEVTNQEPRYPPHQTIERNRHHLNEFQDFMRSVQSHKHHLYCYLVYILIMMALDFVEGTFASSSSQQQKLNNGPPSLESTKILRKR